MFSVVRIGNFWLKFEESLRYSVDFGGGEEFYYFDEILKHSYLYQCSQVKNVKYQH